MQTKSSHLKMRSIENTPNKTLQINRNETMIQKKLASSIMNVGNTTVISKGIELKKNEIQVDITGVYNFIDLGIRDSCIIGTDIYEYQESQFANAFTQGVTACPDILDIPGTLTDSKGQTKIVEIIGRCAFCSCARISEKGKTKKLKVPKQVKVIRYGGLADMWDLEVFEIEAGSKLETIEELGLDSIGYNTGKSPEKRNATLILPSTLSSVFENGIYQCNLFHTIIYCGSLPLTNTTQLVSNVSPTVVMVKSQYPIDEEIFNQNPDNSNPIVTELSCRIMSGDFEYSFHGPISICHILQWFLTLVLVF